jgi:hypothetical protein
MICKRLRVWVEKLAVQYEKRHARLIMGSFAQALPISIASDIFVPFYSLNLSPTTQLVLLLVSLHKTYQQDDFVISTVEITILEKKEYLR